jgi:pimeloyl-ACP methyl ester carboxylesterase
MPHTLAEDGCRLHYADTGRGPAVVMVPGLGGNGAFWQPVAQRLDGAFRVLAVDHRGAGASDRPEGPYTIAILARDVLAVLASAGVGRAHMVGHSTGGLVAHTLALDHPAAVDRLVISGSWAKPDRRFRLLFAARLALLDAGDLVAYQQLTQVLGYPTDWLEANAAALDADLAAAPVRLSPVGIHKARIRMLLDHDRSADLHQIRAPALVLAATDDVMVPAHHARELAGGIPGARLTLLKGGHFFPVVEPDGYAGAVRQFLEETP